jgi:glycosyltransferase involved in cell wall biosynthesis
MDTEAEQIECSIAVLGYRAGEAIVPFVEQLHSAMSLYQFGWELVIVANYWPGDDDRTPEISKQLAERLDNVRFIAEPKQGAMGWDMKAGLDACTGRWVGVIDGDGQFPAEAILSSFAKIRNEDLDLVKTYRVRRGDGILRRCLSWTYNATFKVFFPEMRRFRDANSKPKIISREAYSKMDLRSDDWFIDAEIMLRAVDLDLAVGEIPVEFSALDDRKSFVRPRAIFAFVGALVRERVRRWRRR